MFDECGEVASYLGGGWWFFGGGWWLFSAMNCGSSCRGGGGGGERERERASLILILVENDFDATLMLS